MAADAPVPSGRLVVAAWWWLFVPLLAAGLHAVGVRWSLMAPTASASAFVGLALGTAVVVGLAGTCAGRPGLLAAGVALPLVAGVWLGPWAGLCCALLAVLVHVGTDRLHAVAPSLPAGRGVRALWALSVVLALLQLGRLAVYLADPAATWGALVPDDPQVVRHSCLTSYVHALRLAELGQDLYDPAFDPPVFVLDAALPATARDLAPFTLDMFGYTPVYLLLVRGLGLVADDFLGLRLLFPLLSLGLWLSTLWLVARHLGGTVGRRILWLAPLVTACTPLLVSLQFGNASILLASLCTLAWLGARRGWPGAAGLLIAFATLTRYMPGLLALIVILRRRWRVMLGGVVGTVVLVGASLLAFGTTPWQFFAHSLLPQLAGGQVMNFLDDSSRQIAVNVAPFSLPFKLGALGIDAGGWDRAQTINRGFTLGLLVLTVVAAFRRGTAGDDLLRWSAIAMLGSVATSFAGPHVQVGTAFILVLLAGEVRSRRGVALMAGAWVILLVLPLPLSPTLMVLTGLVQTGVLLALLGWLVLRPGRSVTPAGGSPSPAP